MRCKTCNPGLLGVSGSLCKCPKCGTVGCDKKPKECSNSVFSEKKLFIETTIECKSCGEDWARVKNNKL
jgi:hypothetical protein|tara:strand:- start:346 stop:552 length:207 start_codon:yes stop_codon:yes gene_type:complete